MTFLSHAQNFEDLMLWRALSGVLRGFYIDVGAGDPDSHTVTRAFYERGWAGVNIERSRSTLTKSQDKARLAADEAKDSQPADGRHRSLRCLRPRRIHCATGFRATRSCGTQVALLTRSHSICEADPPTSSLRAARLPPGCQAARRCASVSASTT